MKRLMIAAACAALLATTAAAQDGPLPPQEGILQWTPPQQAVGYRNMEKIYPVRVVKRGAEVRELPVAVKSIDPKVAYGGKTLDTAGWMADLNVSGVLVLKDGQIVLEKYGMGRGPQDRWTSFSVAKSVTSTLVGAAIKDGKIKSLDALVTDYIPELKGSGYDGVTVRQLITMTSGVKWNEDYTDPNSDVAQAGLTVLEPGVNPIVSYMRKLPRENAPGSKFVYKTGETDLAGILVSNAVGKPIGEYLSEKLWAPYGMEQDAVWMLDPGGHERGGCCMSMTLRDYARIGQFILGGGQIDGQLVVPEGWTQEATSHLLDTGDPGEGYGYFWWTQDDGSYAAFGIFGQAIITYPKENLIIAINSAWPKAGGPELYAERDAFVDAVRAATK
jgi:CubicO group peptidase (beta-lactamase class C family)